MTASKNPKTDPAAPCCTWLSDAETFARREPVMAVACAFSAGILLQLLPTRVTGAVVSTLTRPVLLCLGLLKAWELCACNKEPKV